MRCYAGFSERRTADSSGRGVRQRRAELLRGISQERPRRGTGLQWRQLGQRLPRGLYCNRCRLTISSHVNCVP